jgi:hypothetical protein
MTCYVSEQKRESRDAWQITIVKRTRNDVLLRIATLAGVQPAALSGAITLGNKPEDPYI